MRSLRLLLCGTAIALSACSQSGSTTTTTQATSDSAPATATGDPTSVSIYVDGWSEASMAQDALQYTDLAGSVRSIELVPASTDDIAALAARSPETVRNLAARLLTANPTLSCDAERCLADTTEISFSEISNPDSSPYLKGLYGSWKIKTGVWMATLENADNLIYGANRLAVGLSSEEDDLTSTKTETGVRAIGFAWGKPFNIDPAWLRGSTYTTMFTENVDPAATTTPAPVDVANLFTGLGTENRGMWNLTDSHLTWKSSPSTGCGVGVLCVPGVATATVSNLTQKRILACDAVRAGFVEFISVDVAYNYTFVTHQYGLWDEQTPDGSVKGSKVWLTPPPLALGDTKVHHTLMYLYDKRGVVEIAGRIANFANEGADETGKKYTEKDLATMFGGSFSPCTSAPVAEPTPEFEVEPTIGG
jgi:hypothetical protein